MFSKCDIKVKEKRKIKTCREVETLGDAPPVTPPPWEDEFMYKTSV